MKGLIIAVTGASGSIYAKRLMQYLGSRGIPMYLTITEAGKRVMEQELGWTIPDSPSTAETRIKSYLGLDNSSPLRYFDVRDIGAPIASGTFRLDGMVVLPCSMATVSGIATGASSDLVERAADVTLKEGRTLVVVPRETPLSAIHLRNLLTLAEVGVRVLPAMPAFYTQPQKIEDLVDFLIGKILDVLSIDHDLFRRWDGLKE